MTPTVQDNNKKPITGLFYDSSPLLADPEALKKKAEQDGFLFFRGLLEPDRVLGLRRVVLDILDRHGLLDRDKPLLEGIADCDAVSRIPAAEVHANGVGVGFDLYEEVQKLEAFHALAQHPALLEVYKTLFDKEVFPHPRNIARLMLPHPDKKPTPSHQDFLHIQGSTTTWSAWIPLGDVPRELGGLAVLRGSHKAGLLGVTHNPGAGGLESILCELDYDWLTTDYRSGDVLTFHSHTVHKSLPSLSKERVRLSCDFRYQPADEPIDPSSLRPHGPFTWEELYEGWQRSDLQFYWKGQTFALTQFDESIRWQKEKIC